MKTYEKEQELILELCKICDDNKETIELIMTEELDYPYVLGQLMFNRIAALAYVKLKEYDLLKRLNREFVNSLRAVYASSKMVNDCFMTFLSSLSNIFGDCDKPFALLKTIVLL